MIMLHGMSADHRSIAGILEPVFQCRTGWKRIYPDLPGMGKTLGADWVKNDDQMLEVILDFIDRLVPEKRFVVAGDSYGGYLARGVVYRKSLQMDGLLLIVPSIGKHAPPRSPPPQVTLVRDPKLLSELEENDRELLSKLVVQSRRGWEYIRTYIQPGLAIANNKFLERFKAEFSFDPDAPEHKFANPALILLGRQDSVVGYRRAWDILENYPRGTFVVLDRAGHGLGIPGEQDELFRVLVNEWIDRIEGNIE